MAVLDNIQRLLPIPPGAISPGLAQHAVIAEIRNQFWLWFEQNRNTPVRTIKVWVFSYTLRVQDLRSLFVTLFGEQR